MQAAQVIEAGSRNQHSSPVDDDTLLTAAQTRASVGNVSDMAIWRWQRDHRVQFPKPDVVINNRRYWYAGTIRRWKAEQTAKAAGQQKAA